MTWLGWVIVIAMFGAVIGLLWLLDELLKLIVYLGFESPYWPVRVLFFIPAFIIMFVAVLCAASLAKDAKDWWDRPR